MKIRNCLLGLVVLFAGIGAWAQTPPTTNYAVPNIAAIRTQVISPSTYGSINVAGFYTANDGGGGQFNAVTGCSFTATGSIVQSGSLTLTLSAPNSAIIPGMGINNSSSSGSILPPGETVAAVSGITVTLAQAASQATTGATFYFGGNGGTVIMDGTVPGPTAPNCFQRQNYTGDVRQFGAKCDVLYATGDGSVTGGSKQFTSTQVTFSNADIGKVIELNYAGGTNPPFATTIASINNNTGAAVLTVASPNTFPGIATATAANMNIPPNGTDTPGTGWEPGNIGIDQHVSNGAQVQVVETGVVQFSGFSGGTGYQVNDVLYGTGAGGTAKQRAPVQVQVMSVSPLTGGITSYAIVFSGLWALVPNDPTDTNPTSFTWTGGHGTGFGVILYTNNGSFGVANVILTAGGQYNTPPANPVTMTSVSTCTTCVGWSVDLAVSKADWSYGTDDTIALQSTENYAETYPTTMRGLTGAVHLPAAMCYASGLVINRPVAWRGEGPRQSRLIQILGSPGLSVNGSLPAFVTAAVAYPPGDDYDSVSTRFGQPITSFEDLALWGSNPQTTAQVGSTTQTNQSAGLVLTNPIADQFTDVPVYLSNVEIQRFPNHLLSASQ